LDKDRGQRSEVRDQKKEARKQRSEVGDQKKEARKQRPDVRGQKAEVGGQIFLFNREDLNDPNEHYERNGRQ
jgi:hypothetical protein